MNTNFLKNKQLVYLVISQLFSLTGGYIQNVALSAMITETTQGRTKLGLFLFVCYLPVFALSFFTGRLTGRIPPEWVLRITEILLLAMSVLLYIFHDMPYGALLLFGGVWGVIRAFQTPASSSMPRLLCDESGLRNGVSALALAMSVAKAAGPVLSGVLYSYFSYRASFLTNILSYLPSLILLFRLKPERTQNETGETKPKLNAALLTVVFTMSLFGTAYNIIFTGIGEKLGLSKLWFSLFMGLIGVGAALGALIMKKRGGFLFVAPGVSVSLALLSFIEKPPVICAVILFYGLCDYLFFTSAMARIQKDNGKACVSSAMGAYTAVTTGALPLGFLGLGFLSDTLGITAVLWICAAATCGIYIFLFRKMR